ncbi:hypothetical protein [Parvibaculum sp.]|uniref:hypothetical protein n=1 Tax=Parvibaculum sp. TaxID=2024848 RepID=UPI0025DB0E62|nr:hypothetical protein [Parvibaculum sp.]
MSLAEWTQTIAAAIAILGALLSGTIYLVHSREGSIQETRKILATTWTNEGDISSKEYNFIDLSLELKDGDLYGTLTSPQKDGPYDVNVDVGWFSSRATISELYGRRVVTVATVRLKIKGNNNRLAWTVVSGSPPSIIPRNTTLWLSPMRDAQ